MKNKYQAKKYNDIPCEHPGCLHHFTHPCEGCGRFYGQSIPNITKDMPFTILCHDQLGRTKKITLNNSKNELKTNIKKEK